MFSRVQQIEQERNAKRLQRHQKLNLKTTPMGDWIEQPGKYMYKFLEFVFHDHMPDYTKNTLSKKYRTAFSKKSQVSNHITTGMSADTAYLIEYLRGDTVFGGPLTRIEALLEEVLRLERMGE